MPTRVTPSRKKYTKFPPARLRCNDIENKEEATLGAIARMPDATICPIPFVAPKPASGAFWTIIICMDPGNK